MPKVAVAPKRAVEDDDDFRQRAVVNRKEKQEGGMFKLPEGETIFRILKTPRDKQRGTPSVWMEYYVHRSVGPKKVGPLRCGLDVADDSGSCWLCSMVEKLRDNGKSLAAAEMERKKSYAIQVAVWDENLQSLRGPLLWTTSSGKTAKSLSYKLQTIISAPEAKGYVDHEDGYNFSIERSGTGINDTVYTAPVRADERTEVPKQILAKLKPFADVLPAYDKENQKKAYYGETGTAKVREEEEDERPKRSRYDEDDEDEQPKRKPKVVDEDDEDSLDSEPEVDSEEEELDEAPVKKARKPADEENEDDDLEFGEEDAEAEPEEDEEDEAPVAKKKPAKKVVEEDEEEEEAPKPTRKRR